MTARSYARPPDRAPAASAQSAAEDTARRASALRRNSAGILVMLLVQYGLGMGVNLYVQVPRSDQGAGAATALGRALTSSPALLAAHAALGLLLIIAGINVLARAIRTSHAPLIAASAAGLAAILAAGASGAVFTSNGQAGASLAMALLTGIALFCYLANLSLDRQSERRSEMTDVTLRRARPDEARTLSDLALAAKGFWGYDQAFIESCRAELTFSPDEVARRHIVVAELGGLVVGFYSVDGEPPVGELGNLWVRPSEIGTGLGRVMWRDAMTAAAAAGFEYLEIGAEPNAEGFYRKMGAERVGETPSESIPGRMLPVMRVKVPAAFH